MVCAFTVQIIRNCFKGAKISSPKVIFNGFLHVTVKVLNSYDIYIIVCLSSGISIEDKRGLFLSLSLFFCPGLYF